VIPETQHIVSRYVQRRVLLVSLILLASLFAITATLARTYHMREQGLAAEWLKEGNADLLAGRPTSAFEDFRNSLLYDPENPDVQLHLAEALLADGRIGEARYYLLNLWDRAPGSGQVNLDLARASSQIGDVDQASRYFHGAIFGSWDKEPAIQRRKVRLELCEFLLSHRKSSDALAEIAGLAADTPSDNGALREENGRLFSRAGDPGKALGEFEAALKDDPYQSQWLAEAGQAAFDAGDFLKAENYFSRADRANPSDEIHASLLLVRGVLSNDPFMPGLSGEEQASRTLRDFQQGLARLHHCTGAETSGSSSGSSSTGSPGADLESLSKEAQELQKRISLSSLGKDPELRNEVMRMVARMEETTYSACGPATSMDQALKMIVKRHEGNNP
jgi:tetratricopeptide (TPR) repeat protein